MCRKAPAGAGLPPVGVGGRALTRGLLSDRGVSAVLVLHTEQSARGCCVCVHTDRSLSTKHHCMPAAGPGTGEGVVSVLNKR